MVGSGKSGGSVGVGSRIMDIASTTGGEGMAVGSSAPVLMSDRVRAITSFEWG